MASLAADKAAVERAAGADGQLLEKLLAAHIQTAPEEGVDGCYVFRAGLPALPWQFCGRTARGSQLPRWQREGIPLETCLQAQTALVGARARPGPRRGADLASLGSWGLPQLSRQGCGI